MFHGNREREALAHAWLDGHRGDADDRAAPIEERSAAVARVDRGVSLDEHHRSRLTQRADDAAGDGVLESERCAERDDFLSLARAQRRSQAKRRESRVGGRGLDDGEVEFRSHGVDASLDNAAIRQTDGHGRIACDHVHVGEDRVARHEKTRSESGRRFDANDRRHRAANHVLERCCHAGGCSSRTSNQGRGPTAAGGATSAAASLAGIAGGAEVGRAAGFAQADSSAAGRECLSARRRTFLGSPGSLRRCPRW